VARESLIRLCVFGAVLLAMAGWETFAPRRPLSYRRAVRWPANLGISLANNVALRVMLPLGAVGFAGFCTAHGWGVLNRVKPMQYFTLVGSLVLLDLAIYLQHVLLHAVPALWRIHRMHHSDLDIDVTTGIRFHPIEMAISMAIKLAAIAALGTSAVAVFTFEILLNASSLFNHANVTIAPAADLWLRRVIVTPDMHRVHHSIVVRETNSNFGFNLSWWDRLFGTYRAQPAAGHLDMTIGVADFRDLRELQLARMLVQPWCGTSGDYPIGGQ
jgi:sterol desaturase/sphingolipid hydroxylase (fatty acid hydroxylase superfamily)